VITQVFDFEFESGIYDVGVIGGQYGCLQDNPIMKFTVDSSAPSLLFYQCALHPNMGGNITIIPAEANEVEPTDQSAVIGLSIAFALVAMSTVVLLIYIFRKLPGPKIT